MWPPEVMPTAGPDALKDSNPHSNLNIPPIREFIYLLTDKFFNRFIISLTNFNAHFFIQ
jgi:hypothetical protein